MAWAGKILRVNLTKGTVTTEPLNREWARDFVGSRGLVCRLGCRSSAVGGRRPMCCASAPSWNRRAPGRSTARRAAEAAQPRLTFHG